MPAAAVGPEGALITDGRAPEIREYDVEGRLRRILRVDEVQRAVTPEMIQARIDYAYTLGPAATGISNGVWERRYAETPIPDVLPAFESLLVDEMGWLWAEVYGWDPTKPNEWMVFDPEGRAHGIVATPVGLEVRWIGEDRILGVSKDEFGVEYVRQHALKRGLTTAVGGSLTN